MEGSTKSKLIHNNILSIRIATDGFSYCIHSNNGALIDFQHSPYTVESPELLANRLNEITEITQLSNLPYSRVLILFALKEKQLVPSALLPERDLHSLFLLTESDSIGKHFFSNYLDIIGSFLIEMIPDNLRKFIERLFPNARLVNNLYPILHQTFTTNETDMLVVDIQSDYFDIILKLDGELKLVTTFDYTGESDLLYYALNVLKQHDINFTQIPVFMTGNVSYNSSLFRLFQKYLSLPKLRETPELKPFDKEYGQNGKFNQLLNLYRCEL